VDDRKPREETGPSAYYDAARVFAKAARDSMKEDKIGARSVAAQNAFKAIEFALTGLALSKGRRLLDHGQTVQFARDQKMKTAARIVESLTLYSRAYSLDIAALDAKRIMTHMKHVLEEVGELANYNFEV